MPEPRDYRTDFRGCNDRLSRRLAAVAAFVPAGSRVADIGSGHGLLARQLAGRIPGAAARVIASDISREEPVARRQRRAGSPVEYRVGDGLDVLDPADGVDVLVIAGMGSRSMLAILERGLPRLPGVRRLVLQPQTEAPRLRRGLLEMNWCRIRERLVPDRGRYYHVLAAEAGGKAATPPTPLTRSDLLEAGADLLADPTDAVLDYWQRQAVRWERIVARGPAPDGRQRLEQARRILAFLAARRGGERRFDMMQPAPTT